MKTPNSCIIAYSTLLITSSLAPAATSFLGTLDSDFANAGNWDNGAPTGGNNGTIDSGNSADLGSTFGIGTGRLDVGANGTSGTLNINNGGVYNTANGTPGIFVGSGSGSVGTININNGGTLSILGAGADLFLGDTSGGQGFVNVSTGGTLDARKAVEVINGRLFFEVGSFYGGTGRPQDELVIDNNGILGFATDGLNVTTINSTLDFLELGSTSTLQMALGGSYNVGDTWTILTGVTAFSGVSGGDGTGVFGNVVDPNNANHQFTVYYGSGLAGAGEVVVELTAVPEPSAAALLGLSGLALALRRRK